MHELSSVRIQGSSIATGQFYKNEQNCPVHVQPKSESPRQRAPFNHLTDGSALNSVTALLWQQLFLLQIRA